MIRPVHWLVAAAVAVALHVGLFGMANTEPDVRMERSAGRTGAVWGMPVEMVADVVDPNVDPTETAQQVDPTEVTEEEALEETDVVEPERATDPEVTDLAEEAEAVEARRPERPEPVDTARTETIETAEAVTAEPVPASPQPEEADVDEPEQVSSWEGGIAVTAEAVEDVAPVETASRPEQLETVSEVRPVEADSEVEVAAVTPVSEAVEVEAEDAIPMPRIRPVDVPRVEAPPKPKTVSKPQPAPSKPKPQAPTPSRSTSSQRTARTSAPAGEQVGTGGTRQGASGRHLVSSYAGKIAAHLRRHKRYPSNAGTRSGTATVTFSISQSGGVRSARLARTSGNRAFDQEVVAMVRRAAPFPPIPSGIGRNAMTFTVPVRFQPR